VASILWGYTCMMDRECLDIMWNVTIYGTIMSGKQMKKQ